LFVLASLAEGFGRVFIEALSVGLPCIAHDHVTARYVLGPGGYFGDLGESGALAAMIDQILTRGDDLSVRIARNLDARDRFSWDRLVPRYVDMLRRVAIDKKDRNGERFPAEDEKTVELAT
jgi:1,2-diacylglycerol 3-alpha-glucosyltransferase